VLPGVRLVNDSFFNEFCLRLPIPAADAVAALAEKGVLGGVTTSRFYPERDDLADLLLVAATETATAEDVDTYTRTLAEVLR
jgi:glycine dehydrogenase subunit 1